MPRQPAPLGNTRAVKSGTQSVTLVAPLREQHLKHLRADYPHLDERRLVLMADRLARIDLGSAWLERQRGVVRNQDGDVFAVATAVDRWSQVAERLIREAEAERRKPRKIDLAQEMSALADDAASFEANDETLNG